MFFPTVIFLALFAFLPYTVNAANLQLHTHNPVTHIHAPNPRPHIHFNTNREQIPVLATLAPPLPPSIQSAASTPPSLPLLPLPITAASCAYARITRVGLSVTRGTRATMRYDVRLRAVEASVLASSDTSFVTLLSAAEKVQYDVFKNLYRGGLNVPFLKMLGFDLSKDLFAEGVAEAAEAQQNFTLKLMEARRILTSTVQTDIRIRGRLRARGVRCVQTTVFAFIKLAEVTLNDGTNRTILTTANDDLEAATEHGDVVLPSNGGRIDVM